MTVTRRVNLSFIFIFVLNPFRHYLLSFPWKAWTGQRHMVQEVNSTMAYLPVSSLVVSINETADRERRRVMNGTSRPPLSTFLHDKSTTAETRFLLDFVVAGFPKCGTTTLGEWLSRHPEIKMQGGEQNHFSRSISASVRALYNNLPDEGVDQMRVKKGFRCPHHIQHPRGVRLLRDIFQEAKVIVAVRHPVLWFESFYNYRLEQNELSLLKGTPNELIGELKNCRVCKLPMYLSTATGRFHQYLARLGKTALSDPEEMKLLEPFTPEQMDLVKQPKLPNSVFFLETSQLGDKNEARSDMFRADLQQFLGLEEELSPVLHIRPSNKKTKKPANVTRMDICDAEYNPVRSEMLRISRNASLWFRNYFLKSEEVFVSNRGYVEEILESWMVDPCENRL